MLPPFEPSGNLPEGVHSAFWPEFLERFGTTRRRRYLLVGLRAALSALQTAGCRYVYINGSFVTAKLSPGDYDACWDTAGVALHRLDRVFLAFDHGRAAQKAKYRGEFFPAHLTEGGSGATFLDFFQTDRDTGQRKGIVRLDLLEFAP
jgi:hypothetical protein